MATTSSTEFAAIRIHSDLSTPEILDALCQALTESGASETMVSDLKQGFPNRKIITYRDGHVVGTTNRTELWLKRELVDHLTDLCPPRESDVDSSGEEVWYYPEANKAFYEKYHMILYEISPPIWTRFQEKKEFTRDNAEGEPVTETKEYTSNTIVVHLPGGDSDESTLHRNTICSVIKNLMPSLTETLFLSRGAFKLEYPHAGATRSPVIKIHMADWVSLDIRQMVYWMLSGRGLLVTAANTPYLINYSVMWGYKPQPRPARPLRR